MGSLNSVFRFFSQGFFGISHEVNAISKGVPEIFPGFFRVLLSFQGSLATLEEKKRGAFKFLQRGDVEKGKGPQKGGVMTPLTN